MHPRNKIATQELKKLLESTTIDEVMILVRAGADPDLKDSKGNGFLHRFIETADDNTLKELVLTYKANIELTNKEGQTPLQKQMNLPYFSTKTAMKLVRLKANPLVTDKQGRALLHRIVLHNKQRNKDTDIVALVNEFKIDINIKNKQTGQTPLLALLATPPYPAKLDFIKWLVQLQAALWATDNEGLTPLHYAAFWGDADVCAWLTQQGKLAATVKDRKGHTPIDYARSQGHIALADTLENPAMITTTPTEPTPIPPPRKNDLLIFKEKHRMSLAHSGIFKAIKKFFSQMRDLLWNDPQEPIKTMNDVKEYAKKKPCSRTAHILKVMNSRMTIQEFKAEYDAARSKQLFSNPFETRMRNLLKTLNTPRAFDDFDMETVRDHAINRPDSLTAQIITRYSP